MFRSKISAYSLLLLLLLLICLNDFTDSMRIRKSKKSKKKPVEENPIGIGGGRPVDNTEAKFMAVVYTEDSDGGNRQVTGSGVLLDEKHILTAGHVCWDYHLKSVHPLIMLGGWFIGGDPSFQRQAEYFMVSKEFVESYERYKKNNHTTLIMHDICVLSFTPQIDLNYKNQIKLAQLVPQFPTDTPGKMDDYIQTNLDIDDCWTLGFGLDNYLYTGYLNKLPTPIYVHSVTTYTCLLSIHPKNVDRAQFTSYGDSGGPLLCRKKDSPAPAPGKSIDFNENYMIIGIAAITSDRSDAKSSVTSYEPIRFLHDWIYEQLKMVPNSAAAGAAGSGGWYSFVK